MSLELFVNNHKDFINVIVQTIGVVATFFAVTVSLMLANRKNKLKLKIRLSIRSVISNGIQQFAILSNLTSNTNTNKYVAFDIQNKGLKTAILQSTNFYMDFKKADKEAMNFNPSDSIMTKYPREIVPGDATMVLITDYNSFIEMLSKNAELFKNINKFEAFIVAPSGEKIKAKISKSTRNEIIKDVEKIIRK